jgi:hypothetical protein
MRDLRNSSTVVWAEVIGPTMTTRALWHVFAKFGGAQKNNTVSSRDA